MNSSNKNTAILVFSRSAKAEATEKKLFFSTQKAESMAALMIEQTLKTVQKTGLPYYFISEKQQIGSNFGGKLGNAFESIFSKGYQNVIAIGNDCLKLSSSDILKAARLLENTPSVLGPSTDGGVYLMGFQKQVFSKNAFENIDWQTENVFSQLCILNDNIKILPTLSDIDSVNDLIQQVFYLNKTLKKAILNLLFEIQNSIKKEISAIVLKVFLTLKSLRAPPVV